MAKIPSPLHVKRIPKNVSKPTETAEAAAAVAESSVAPVRRRAAKKAKPSLPTPAPKKAKPPASASASDVAPDRSARVVKLHKPKLVRDSFTMPKDEYQVIEALKQRALGLGKHVRKSELLRAGIRALAAMNDRALLKAVDAIPTLKTGRPKAE